jgi:hypothetical protein
MTSLVTGSIRTTRLSCSGLCAGTVTQTPPSPTATSAGYGPTGTTALTRGCSSTGSARASPPPRPTGPARNPNQRPPRLAADSVSARAITAPREPRRSCFGECSIDGWASSEAAPESSSLSGRRSPSLSLTFEPLSQGGDETIERTVRPPGSLPPARPERERSTGSRRAGSYLVVWRARRAPAEQGRRRLASHA